MAKLKLLFFLCIMLVSLLLCVAFLLRNSESIAVDLFLIQSSQFTVGTWIVASFIVGGLLGLLVRIPGLVVSSARYKAQSRKVESQAKKIERLSQDPQKVS